MKRFAFPIAFVGIAVIALAVVGYFVVRSIRPAIIYGNPPVRYDELVELQEKGEAAAPEIPRVVACLDYYDEVIRAQAAETLSKIGPKAVGPVRAKLKSGDPKTRFWAVQTIALLGPGAKDAADDMLPLLKDDDASVRYKTVYALGKIGVNSDAVLGGLIKALTDSDHGVSEAAIAVLDKFGAPPKDALPTLADFASKGSTPQARRSAMILLARLGPDSVPAFRDLLKQGAPQDQLSLMEAIVVLGPDGKALLPELVPVLEQHCRNANGMAVSVIAICSKLGAEGAKAMADTLKATGPQASPTGRVAILRAIGAMRSEAEVKATVPILIELLQNNETSVEYRTLILDTLGEIGVPAREAISIVETLTSDANVGEAARVALRRMGKIDAK
jgi:HEAT repeat protein